MIWQQEKCKLPRILHLGQAKRHGQTVHFPRSVESGLGHCYALHCAKHAHFLLTWLHDRKHKLKLRTNLCTKQPRPQHVAIKQLCNQTIMSRESMSKTWITVTNKMRDNLKNAIKSCSVLLSSCQCLCFLLMHS